MYARKSSIVSVEISRKWTDDFGTFWGHLRRSALQPLPQCTASALAVHCIRPCTALHPPLHCTASVLALHCIFSRMFFPD